MCVGKAGLGEWPPRGLRQAVCRTLRVFSTSCTSTLANWQGILGKLMLKLTRMRSSVLGSMITSVVMPPGQHAVAGSTHQHGTAVRGTPMHAHGDAHGDAVLPER